jgi:hypothetical protein
MRSSLQQAEEYGSEPPVGSEAGAVVAAACKGFGSASAAARYTSGLPATVTAVDLSACGLYQLPDLVRRTSDRVTVDQSTCTSTKPTLIISSHPDTNHNQPAQDHLHRVNALAAGFNCLSSLLPAPSPARPRRPGSAGSLAALGDAVVSRSSWPALQPPLGSHRGIGRLPPRLLVLSLCRNELVALPPYLVGALPLLEELDISFNR